MHFFIYLCALACHPAPPGFLLDEHLNPAHFQGNVMAIYVQLNIG
jgi:hypothetical protein